MSRESDIPLYHEERGVRIDVPAATEAEPPKPQSKAVTATRACAACAFVALMLVLSAGFLFLVIAFTTPRRGSTD